MHLLPPHISVSRIIYDDAQQMLPKLVIIYTSITMVFKIAIPCLDKEMPCTCQTQLSSPLRPPYTGSSLDMGSLREWELGGFEAVVLFNRNKQMEARIQRWLKKMRGHCKLASLPRIKPLWPR